MKRFVLLCGPPYSGKEEFAKGTDGYNYQSVDYAFESLGQYKRGKVISLFNKYDKKTAAEINNTIDEYGLRRKLPSLSWTNYANLLIGTKQTDLLHKLQQKAAEYLVGENMKGEQFPMVNGIYATAESRNRLIKNLSAASGTDIMEIPKTFIYFDPLTADIFARYDAEHKERNRKHKFLKYSLNTIIENISSKQTPSTRDMPKLEVLFINNDQDIEDWHKLLQSYRH